MCINYGQKHPWGGDEWFSYENFTIMGLPFSILTSIMKNILGDVSLANFWIYRQQGLFWSTLLYLIFTLILIKRDNKDINGFLIFYLLFISVNPYVIQTIEFFRYYALYFFSTSMFTLFILYNDDKYIEKRYLFFLSIVCSFFIHLFLFIQIITYVIIKEIIIKTKSVHYDVNKETGLIDYNDVEKLAEEHKPKLIIAGGSAYSRIIDFKKFKEIAKKVNAYLMVDMAHFSGLVAGKGYPNPVDYADVVTSTTHKVLRGARGGIILTNNEDIYKKINSAVFPGYQGGPLMHIIAAKAVAFQEALQPDFVDYIKSVKENAKILSETLKNNGFKIFSGGTDTHLMLVDLRPFKVTGKDAETSLCRANITCNKNGIPFDTAKPTITSGIRLGSQAATTRGFGLNEFKTVGNLITKVIEGLSKNSKDNTKIENEVRAEVIKLCSNFPIYNHLN